ncbi:MAG: prepilin-type N-terminal cleavage/methylation domain-containing protein [Holophagaceae bacterium]
MAPTPTRRSAPSGYSLIELLVVLAIVAILAIAGVSMLGNRQAGAVRALMDEVEGALTSAHKAAAATGRDVAIVTWGDWSTATPLILAHGDASLTDEQIQTTANNLLLNIAPAAALGPAGQSVAIAFRFQPNDPVQSRARFVAVGSSQWTNVMLPSDGKTNQALTSVEPFNTGPMVGLIADSNNLFTFSSVRRRVVVSGSNKRFTDTLIIPMVGTGSTGGALPAGPMGMVVVLANGGSIYKFYNPGARDSDGNWRRL